MVSQQLQNWFAERRGSLFHERTQSVRGQYKAGWRAAVRRLVAPLAPGLSPEDASRLFSATYALAERSGAAVEHLATLREVTVQPFELSTTLVPSLMARHNFELKAKLEVMAVLPEPSPQSHAEDVTELRRTLEEVPDPDVSQFASRWLPPNHFRLTDDREALCFLFPIPRSLIRAARQVAWERAHPERGQPVEDGTLAMVELSADFLVLKVLQRLTALHTCVHSPDGPGPWTYCLYDRDSQFTRQCLFHLATKFAQSTAVMQSTYTSNVLEGLVRLFQNAANPDCDQAAEASVTHADCFSPAWVCAACNESRPTVAGPEDLLPASPPCTCVGLCWSWRDLEGYPGEDARLRAWRRCLWWAQQRSNKRKVALDVFDVADCLQEALSLGSRLTARGRPRHPPQ